MFTIGLTRVTLIGFVCFAVDLEAAATLGAGRREYCQWDTFNATCPHNQVIMITAATYGRMRLGKCIPKAYGREGCETDVTSYLDSHCSGRRECKLDVAEISLAGIHPCAEDLVSYMEASYTCIPVRRRPTSDCTHTQHHYTVDITTTGPGYITHEPVRNSHLCPWRLRAQPGQRINLTLYDFSVFPRTRGGSGEASTNPAVCPRYATVMVDRADHPICGGTARVRNVFLSDGAHLDLKTFDGSSHDNLHFVLRYEAVGCTRIPQPLNSVVHYGRDTMTITCNITHEKWYLTCRGNQWIGQIHNCTRVKEPGLWAVLADEWSTPYGILVIVGLGVILGVGLGVVLLLCAVFIIRRHTNICDCIAFGQTNKSLKTEVTTYTCDVNGKFHSSNEDYGPRAWMSQRPLPNPEHEADLLGIAHNPGQNEVFIQGNPYPTNPKQHHPTAATVGGSSAVLESYPMAIPCTHSGAAPGHLDAQQSVLSYQGAPHVYTSPQMERREFVFVDT